MKPLEDLQQELGELDADIESARASESWQAVAALRRLRRGLADRVFDAEIALMPPKDPYAGMDTTELYQTILDAVPHLPTELWEQMVERRYGSG